MPSRKRKSVKPAKPSSSASRRFSPQWVREQLARQKAEEAVKSFRPRKSDYGKIIFVGVHGQRSAAKKGRKGFLVYVDSSGQKRVIKSQKSGYRPAQFRDIEPVEQGGIVRIKRKFRKAKLEQISQGATLRVSHSITSKGVWDFNDKMVRKMALQLRKGIESQRARRRFVIEALVLVRLSDGSRRTIPVGVDISRPDHIAIKLAGIETFVEKKFYAAMAQELAVHGFVSSGSANHIRRLADNEGVDEEEFTDSRGEVWRGIGKEVVKIERIDWRLMQIK